MSHTAQRFPVSEEPEHRNIYPTAPPLEPYKGSVYPDLHPTAPPIDRSEPPPPYSEGATQPQNQSIDLRMSVAYINEVINIVSHSQPLKDTAKGVLTQTGYLAGVSILGGLLFGKNGAFAGGLIGAFFGYQQTDDYDSLITSISKMDDRDKTELARKVQDLVGSENISVLQTWITDAANRNTLLSLLASFVSQASRSR